MIDYPSGIEAVAIGSSAGGIEALNQILPQLPKDFFCPLLHVQHIGRGPNGEFSAINTLNRKSKLTVVEAVEKCIPQPAHAYFASPNLHLLIELDTSFSYSIDPPENHARPAIDVLFETAAEAYQKKLIGILLTGASQDGAVGIKTIRKYGGYTIVQDPLTAYCEVMPESALKITEVDQVLEIPAIIDFLVGLHEKNKR